MFNLTRENKQVTLISLLLIVSLLLVLLVRIPIIYLCSFRLPQKCWTSPSMSFIQLWFLCFTMYSLGFKHRLFVADQQERCADRSSQRDCEGWKKAGFCVKHESLIYHCKKTCNLCSSGKDLRNFIFLMIVSRYCISDNKRWAWFPKPWVSNHQRWAYSILGARMQRKYLFWLEYTQL